MCENTSFKAMKKLSHKFEPLKLHYRSERAKMMRSGKSGTATEVLGTELSKRIDNVCRTLFHESAPDFPYDEFYNQPRANSSSSTSQQA